MRADRGGEKTRRREETDAIRRDRRLYYCGRVPGPLETAATTTGENMYGPWQIRRSLRSVGASPFRLAFLCARRTLRVDKRSRSGGDRAEPLMRYVILEAFQRQSTWQ